MLSLICAVTVAGLIYEVNLLKDCRCLRFHLLLGKLSMWWGPQISFRTRTCPAIWDWREWSGYVDSNISFNISCLLLICHLDMPSLWSFLWLGSSKLFLVIADVTTIFHSMAASALFFDIQTRAISRQWNRCKQSLTWSWYPGSKINL